MLALAETPIGKDVICVVHLITGLNPGGTERQLLELVRCSDGHHFRHLVVSMTEAGSVSEELAAAGIEVHALGMRAGIPSLAGLFRLVKVLRRFRPDVLQCWLYHADLLGLLAGNLVGVPHILWGIRSSDVDFAQYRRLTHWVVRLCARFSRYPDCIVVNSEAGKRLHHAWGYTTSKMVVIPNGFDLEVFKPDPEARRSVRRELGVGDDTLLIGFIARFDPMKDHGTFFKAAGLLSRREGGVHFLLAGLGVSPTHPDLSRMVRENSLDGLVHLLGVRGDMPRLTAALDIACLPSWGEGFPNVVGEAMACGVPCVVSDVGDVAYLVGDTGRVVRRRDPQALAAALCEFVEIGPAERQALGNSARKRMEDSFSLLKLVRSYESLYEALSP